MLEYAGFFSRTLTNKIKEKLYMKNWTSPNLILRLMHILLYYLGKKAVVL